MTKTLDEAGLDLIFRTARSYNGYAADAVSDADLQAIYDLAKMGPTAANQQPMRIVWVKSSEAKQKLSTLVSANNEKKVLGAPVTAIIGMDHDFPETLAKVFPHTNAKAWFEGNRPLIESSAFRNSSLQGAYLILAARALGFDVGPMSGFDNDKVDEAFFAGTNIKSNFIATIGHGDPASIFDRLPRLDFDETNSIV
ncbi:malonic semialdehyde reductase [Sphingomonas oryzagri]|jgi:3-hydroxypropanoate dehydrogenase|uniref:Putative NADH dehydrogenase/NAD(P)H nitroreductase QGN17_09735 n=1 Tax=Sphingomonas oryzagri TaxID=3042314 RepID=A0ABT6N129_9SPHN|nr:malonic semialdehyde reductase [Sphingomonas oryzagri]MDH7639008.1 malonic semialdehyde reductase [Sphingomonas oryzagri]